jgi:GntR family carbon starvation induced transcriptional regulator
MHKIGLFMVSTPRPQPVMIVPKAMASEPTLSERAYGQLRAQILTGELQPGQKLTLQLLQHKFSLSSSPLREALNRLTSDGLVLTDGRRGFRAAPISIADIEDITFLRLVLESAGLEQSIDQGKDDWEARIVAAFYRLELIESRVDFGRAARDDSWTERHREFHLALISACQSPRLLASCASLFDQSERYRRLSPKLRKERRDTLEEHKRLMQLVLKRQKAAAVAMLRDHYCKTTENLVREFSQQKAVKKPR